MKNTLTLFLAVTMIALAVVCVVQTRKSSGHQIQVAALQGDLEAKSQEIENLQAAKKRADQQRRELRGQAEELAAQLQARQLAETNVPAPVPPPAAPASAAEKPGEEKGGFDNMLSKMMQDPDTRKFTREQQHMRG
ncbi:MAG: hypothetical protein NT154_14480 [Verrucomicrobia bacterium]|nr:hypothetical protein [Verrucomicrobiota bacterium]